MRREGRLQLVVRSQKVARLVEFEVPLVTVYGKVGSTTRRATVYDYVLDEQQTRAVSQAREFAARLGLALDVTDLAKEGAVKRLFRAGSARLRFEGRPTPAQGVEPKTEEPVPVS